MKRNIFKKVIISVLSLSLMFTFSGPVTAASHAANGANVIPNTARWTSFSVRDDLHTKVYTEWEEALCKAIDEGLKDSGLGQWYTKVNNYKYGSYEKIGANREKALEKAKAALSEEEYNKLDEETGYGEGIMGWQSWTHGRIMDGTNYSDGVVFDCSDTCLNTAGEPSGSTGGDGEYAAKTKGGKKELIGDNPWGLYLSMDNIPVEFGRYYTLDFDIASTLYSEKDNLRKDKHILVKAYDPQSSGEPAASFETFKVDNTDESKTGEFVIKKTPNDSSEYVQTHVTATFKIPQPTDGWSGGKDKGLFTKMGIKLSLGAHDFSLPEESWLKGKFLVSNVKVLAGTQYAAKYYDGNTLKATKYVNEYEKAPWVALTKKGYTLDSYIDKATGKKYSFGNLVYKDINLKAKWVKTPKPKKANFTLKSKKKRKVTVTFKKNANAKGYQVKYSYSKKFKKKAKYKTKTKTTSKTKTYTIKSLKSSKVLYVKARAYNKDSCGNKKYGKWSKRKTVYVK